MLLARIALPKPAGSQASEGLTPQQFLQIHRIGESLELQGTFKGHLD